MIYINFQYENEPIETIGVFDSMKEARRVLGEYNMAHNSGCRYWVSRRATKDYYATRK